MKRVLVVMALVLAACGGDSDEVSSGNAETTTTAGQTPSATEATTSTSAAVYGTTAVSTPADSEQGDLVAVTTGEHDGLVRVVFRFSNLVPGYNVEPAEPPFVQDGSGEEVDVRGDGHLSVRLTARAHDDDGKSSAPLTIVGNESAPLREVRRIGDFEGVVQYVIGLDKARPFRVYRLSSPARLVVDIAVA